MFEEQRYQATRWSLWTAGQAVRGTISGVSAGLLTVATGGGGIIFWPVAAIGFTLGSVLSKRLHDMDHDREEERMVAMYRREIAAQTGFNPEQITKEDLRNAAAKNPTLQQAIDVNDKMVSSNMKSWVASAVISTVIVGLMFVGIPGLFAAPLATMLPASPLAAAGVRALFGALCFNLAKPVTDYVSDRINGLNRHTSHEYIKELNHIREQGRKLQPEQVLGVFVKAHPAIDQEVQREYGVNFDKLVRDQKFPEMQKILDKYDDKFNISALTEDINNGRILVSELAYAAHGQKSGVEAVEPDTRSHVEKAREAVSKATEVVKEKAHEAAAHVSHAWQQAKQSLGIHNEVSQQEQTFVERIGRSGGARIGSQGFAGTEDARRSQGMQGVIASPAFSKR
jgi:hypothetical protein